MQVANTTNNTIRILFNPRVEDFRLFDFLVVKSDDNRYVAQIIEIYDDKFDASQNVAKLKLFYRINENNEVMPYDNFTPNKECEISKVKQEEIEAFINNDKDTFILGTNVKNLCGLNVQYNFFNNNPIVLADKIENANAITLNLAKKLSEKRNTVIIDTTGVLECEGVKKINAIKNFKLPLNYSTIDHVFNRCLFDASLEFQAIGGEIINEIKKFAKKQEDNFIPFNLLTRVLIQQYKATPYPELKLLLVRLKKYQMDEIFARTKNEKESLFKAVEKNPITIIDLSNIDSYWQKTYLDYIVSDIEKEIYLITRINDEHFDVDLVNKIYNKKKNIKFIPNVSYSYKKLPSVMQYCKNYILMPSLVQRTDFLDANFALSNLISDGCIIFGQNTDNFLYMIKDYELEIQEKRKNYRKIALTLVQQDAQQNLGEKGDYFVNKEKEELTDSQRLIQELSEFEANRQEEIRQQQEEEKAGIKKVAQETFEDIENPNFAKKSEDILEDKNINEDVLLQDEEQKDTDEDHFQNLNMQNNDSYFEDNKDEQEQQQETQEEVVEVLQEEVSIQTEVIEESFEEKTEEVKKEAEDELPILQDEEQEEFIQKENETQEDEFSEEEQDMELSDDELDFFQMAQESEEEYEDVDESDDIDLSAIADESIDNNFEQIINTKNQQKVSTIEMEDNTKISADIIENSAQKENLPIFKEEKTEQTDVFVYKVGNIIMHKKYGKGTVVKTIKYEERQLLQIEFEEAGKKLLDPKVADIKLEQ